jgi:cytidine deaminase
MIYCVNTIMKILKRAAKLACTCTENKNFLVACIAQRKDGVFVFATNSRVRVPEASAHSEAKCLKKAGHGAILWVVRVLRKDRKTWAMAKPCSSCATLIRNKKVKRVYYTVGPNQYCVWDP